MGERVPPRAPLLGRAIGGHHRVVVVLEGAEEAVEVSERREREERGECAAGRAYFRVHAEGVGGGRLGQGSLDRSLIWYMRRPLLSGVSLFQKSSPRLSLFVTSASNAEAGQNFFNCSHFAKIRCISSP